MTSEQDHRIVKQPIDTCPMIDDVLRTIDAVHGYLRRWEDMDEKELREACSSIEWVLGGIVRDVEKIRDNVTKVRVWGNEWKDKAKEYHEQIPE